MCDSQGCSATNKSALYTCFSGDCVRTNGSRPLRLCLTCHKELHESPEKEPPPAAPAGSARSKKGAGGAHHQQQQASVASPTSGASAAHVVQHTLSELCDYDERLHQYLPDAIVRSALSFLVSNILALCAALE